MNNIVTSYYNPDTDGVACMIAMSEMMPGYKAVVQGELSSETMFVLKKLGLDTPASCVKWDAVDNIILVDTHHLAQIGKDFPVEKVGRIIDHHSGGDDEAFVNATIDNRKIGAAASIVGEMLLKKSVSGKIAELLQYAIASNTLNFTAPSTTDFDEAIFEKLAEISLVGQGNLAEMFKSRKMNAQNATTDISADLKLFKIKEGLIGISQIEEYDLLVNISEIKKSLNRICEEEKLAFAVFNGVDINDKKSTIIFSDSISDSRAMSLFGMDVHNGICVENRILLRKTDFIPKLDEALRKNGN